MVTGRLLLLMTTRTYRASAFLDAADKLGIPVLIGTDQPLVFSAETPNQSLTLDFTRPDESANAITRLTDQIPIRAVVPAEDEEVIVAATAASALNLPSNPVDSIVATRDKFLMRQALSAEDIPSPNFTLIDLQSDLEKVAEAISYPCVIKPTFLAGSRGVIRANHPGEFLEAAITIREILTIPEVAHQGGQRAGQALVEDYIPGKEVALEGLLSRGQLRVLAIFDKPDPLEGPYFEETIYVTPSRLPELVQQRIIAQTAQGIQALGLQDGPVHAELRINEGGVWIIEIAPRSIGGLCSRTLRFGEDTTLEELILRHSLGMETNSLKRETIAAGAMMIPIPHAGILRGVEGRAAATQVEYIEDVIISVPAGQRVVPPPRGDRYLGFIFARAETPTQVEESLHAAHSCLKIDVEMVE